MKSMSSIIRNRTNSRVDLQEAQRVCWSWRASLIWPGQVVVMHVAADAWKALLEQTQARSVL
jgi:hypothetical protein